MTLTEYLNHKGKSFNEFSRLVEIAPAQLSRYVNGVQKPSLDNAYKIYLKTNRKVNLQDWYRVSNKKR
jgi:transcriptional regulator with XRE-family HTH domain